MTDGCDETAEVAAPFDGEGAGRRMGRLGIESWWSKLKCN